jgi:hypothetical protein
MKFSAYLVVELSYVNWLVARAASPNFSRVLCCGRAAAHTGGSTDPETPHPSSPFE